MEKATRKKNISPWIKALVFLLLLLSLVLSLQGIFYGGDISNNYLSVSSFHDEPRDTLDAVYIGGSNVYYFWQPSLAWQEYGMAVYNCLNPDIASGSSVGSGITKLSKAYCLSVIDTCREINRISLLDGDISLALTIGTLVPDYLTCSAAIGADLGTSHKAEYGIS